LQNYALEEIASLKLRFEFTAFESEFFSFPGQASI